MRAPLTVDEWPGLWMVLDRLDLGGVLTLDDVVFVSGDRRVTRGEYQVRVAKAAALLEQLGVGTGDCIGIALRNRPQFFELLAAAGAVGAKAVPIAWRLKHDELRYLIEDSKSRAVFFEDDRDSSESDLRGVSLAEYERLLGTVDPAIQPSEVISGFNLELYSSGTTGRPKGIERTVSPAPAKTSSEEGVPDPRLGFLETLGVAGPGEVHLLCGPLYHSQPIGFSTQALAAGHRVVMMEGSFDAEMCLRTIEREKVTWMTCVPTHFIRILALPEETRGQYDLSSLKAVMHSAAPCPRDVKTRVMDLFPPDTVWESYGGTEGSMAFISPQEWTRKPGSVGRAFPPGTELHILDQGGTELAPGEVGLVYSRAIMPFRYRGAPELDAETWKGELFTVGDMGYLDEDGYLFITDRLKDMIITGGANVYPAEVEAVLFNHPAVADAAVIGIPDPEWGESVRAIVEPRAEVSVEEIINYCRQHLAHYKCPTSAELVERLPRDPNGKVRKRELREKYWAHQGRAI
jgi:long-chain acyl-CoA synthetase